jgi:23S rRNA (guanosine2251-2'-O)-methyltransferase
VKETIYGRHPVQEMLRAGRRKVHRILVATRAPRAELSTVLADSAGVPVEEVTTHRLDSVSKHHQGIAAIVSGFPYTDLTSVLARADHAGALVLILDQLQDPQNLGAVLRTSEAVGVSGVLIPGRGAAGITPAVAAASAGACEHLMIVRTNLAQAMRQLKERGLWIIGLENHPESQRIDQADFAPPLAIVVGNEGRGLRRLVRESCDFLVRIPMRGRTGSLNAAVAGSIALHEAWRRAGYADAIPGSQDLQEQRD